MEENKKTKFTLNIIIDNKTNNVVGGDNNKNFGTWFYLNLTINHRIYNVDDFQNVVIENSENTGGGRFGRTGHKDVFITPINSRKVILTYDLTNENEFTYIGIAFGTFYQHGFGHLAHAELTGTKGYQNGVYRLNRFWIHGTTGNNGINLIITATGVKDANSASWGLEYYKF